MREALFVKQNSRKWKQYENFHTNSPDDLAAYFVEITNDLAYAKTFYPDSKTTFYLNGLASRFHQLIYQNKREKSRRFFLFWTKELPFLFRKYRFNLFYSFLFFFGACVIGAFSAKFDDQFLKLILGPQYVNMTNENIAKGDPFGVYKQIGEFPMFFYIAQNNIIVMFKCFILGIFFSVGTVILLMNNGIMIGSFHYFFFEKGLGLDAVMVIWIHGVLEIASIIITGAAGLILGNSILFPQTFNRLTSFKRGAKDGLKICIGTAPIMLFAAFIEGYITRHTEMPFWLSILILTSSLIFIIWYVIIYPATLAKRLSKINS